MVEYIDSDLDGLFQALADPTRRAIVQRLGHGEATISELAAPFPISLAAVSKHVGVLAEVGLVTRRKTGRKIICTLEPTRLGNAWEWLDFHLRFWNERLDALDQHLSQSIEEPHT